MCASNENAKLSERSSSPDSQAPSNGEVPTSQTEHSPMLHCPPLMDQPVNIPTSSRMLLSSALYEPSSSPKEPSQMDEDCWSSVAEVLQASQPAFQLQVPQAPAPSISQKPVPASAATEPVTAGQPRSKPRTTRLGRPSSASRKSTSAGCHLKSRLQPRSRGSFPNGNSQSTKEARLPVHPRASHASRANPPVQATIQPRPLPLVQSVRAAVANAIHVEPLEYMLYDLDNCISHMLVMLSPMQTFIRIRIYPKIFTDFSRQEVASSPITTLDDLRGSCTRCLARLGFA